MPRSAGILLHATSLPGRLGIGDFGPGAEAFLRWAAEAGQSVWQVLPLAPTDPYNSPYSGLSAFAGNPLLVSPERLRDEGLLPASSLVPAPRFPPERADYRRLIPWRQELLRIAWERFPPKRGGPEEAEFASFLEDPAQRGWLEDWALFSALRRRYHGRAWTEWDRDLARRDDQAIAAARRDLGGEIRFHAFVQWLFFRQWERVRALARSLGIRILGDVPIYVAHDSADVWASPGLFDLDEDGRPREVAGVPPDYFSASGQRWGNPLYRWDRMEEEGFAWWVERIRANLRLADAVRIDHFRGFVAYWAIPAAEPTAVGGRWVPGPGAKVFEAIRGGLGNVSIVAEDLGHITDEVRELRRSLGLPGMRVLQFAFEEPGSEHLPANHERSTVVFTGTHDNDTARGWFRALGEDAKRRVLEALGGREESVEWDLLRAAYGSEADLAIAPMQDVLGLGSEARMNTPAKPSGNWEWRARRRHLRADLASKLRELAAGTGRLPGRDPLG